MGKPVNSNAKRLETTTLNTEVNKEVFDLFKDYCRELGYPMNMVIETFMNQYTNGRFNIDPKDIIKWKYDNHEMDLFGTSINKEIYLKFKAICKGNGYSVKHVITAFMEKFSSRNFILEYINIEQKNKNLKDDKNV